MTVKYENTRILAPMVRVSTLPMRLLALKYGADLVYTEEIVDFKILRSIRTENKILNTIDYVMDDGTVTFRTCQKERNKVVFQLATADSSRALEAARLIEKDVCAVDINMGCPKAYSVKGGMGAAMLKNPSKSCEILKLLSDNLSIPVTCKIRILPTLDDTLALVSQLCATGISAIAVHGRYVNERPRHPVHDDVIKRIAAEIKNVTVIANGGSSDFIKTNSDIEYFKQCCGVSSVMVARAAMWNPAIFSDSQQPSAGELIEDYVKLAVRYDNYISSTKYCITQLLHDNTESPGFRETLSVVSNKELCDVWSMTDYFNDEMNRRQQLSNDKFEEPVEKKPKIDLYKTHINGRCKFLKRLYGKTGWSPKLFLIQYSEKMKWEPPKFFTEEDKTTRLFRCSIVLNDAIFTNDIGDKNKRFTEQAASCICLRHLNLLPDELVNNGLVVEIK